MVTAPVIDFPGTLMRINQFVGFWYVTLGFSFGNEWECLASPPDLANWKTDSSSFLCDSGPVSLVLILHITLRMLFCATSLASSHTPTWWKQGYFRNPSPSLSGFGCLVLPASLWFNSLTSSSTRTRVLNFVYMSRGLCFFPPGVSGNNKGFCAFESLWWRAACLS